MRLLVMALPFLLAISACKHNNEQQNTKVLSPHYTAIIQELTSGNVKLIKYIQRDSVRDTLTVNNVNWEQELSLFLKNDINLSALGDYDSIVNGNNCAKTYQTTLEKYNVKSIKYDFCANGYNVVTNIVKNTALYNFNYHLELNTKGFLIEAFTDVKMAYEHNYRIEGKFIK